ncbi:LOW QUALITY PROTEIN: hypothetical protein V2J09_019061 [Rumex salicifolius]
MEGLGEQGGWRPIRIPESISRWSISCIITLISQFSLLLVLFFSPSLSLLPNLFFSGIMLLIVAVVAKAFKRLLNLRASAPALVFLNVLFIWLVYFAVLRQAISPSRSILFSGSLVLLVFGIVRILGSDPGLVRHNNFDSDDIVHFPNSYSANHEEFQVPSLSHDNSNEGAPALEDMNMLDEQIKENAGGIPLESYLLDINASFSMRRVRYCKICKGYVRGFDHHCPAFGNCIGERNYVLFMGLLIGFIAVEGLYILSTFEFARKFKMQRLNRSEVINCVNLAVSTMFFCLLQVLWQVVFLAWHIYCICSNIRTDEWINWRKYPEFQLMDHPSSAVVFTNPYDKGILGNVKDFVADSMLQHAQGRITFRLLLLLLLHLRNSHSKHSILHRSLNFLQLAILRQPEPPEELTTAPLRSVPPVGLLLVLLGALAANPEDSAFFQFHLNFFLVQPRKIRLEHVSFRRLFPVDPETSRADEDGANWRPSNGSHTSSEKGSKTLVLRPPKKLGISDIVREDVSGSFGWNYRSREL